jgi:hypothetical protein
MLTTVFLKPSSLKYVLVYTVLIFTTLYFSPVKAAPSSKLWPRWQTHDPDSIQVVDYATWDHILKKYLITDHPSGINRFQYSNVSLQDSKKLNDFIGHLQQIGASSLNREEQKAYWINLYNALTVKIILDHYPIESIKDIDISPGLFSIGPWDAKMLTIEEEKISLNDIEHRILRPIFKDNRIHYAVNCASLGCPDLQPVAFTSTNMDKLLEIGAKKYINSPRGARVHNEKLYVSKIYIWFEEDFGGNQEGVIKHMLQYANDELASVLRSNNKRFRGEYDWGLNEP